MDTRSKNKPVGQPSDTASEPQDVRGRDLDTKEYELNIIENAVKERERRLQAQENNLRLQLEQIERDKRQLDRERENFNQTTSAREEELTAREKRWQDSEVTRLEDFPPTPRRVAMTQAAVNFNYTLPRTPPGGDNGGNGGGNNGNGGRGESPIPKVSFREATEAVPYFDGYNIPLSKFTRACRRAREIIPRNAEKNLTKLLINKLGNRAYYAVEDEPCDTVVELIDLLTGAFGTAKTLDQYRGELSIIYLKPGEHVLDFISRVKELRASILDTERRERGGLDTRFVSDVDSLTARSFYEGLPLEYRLQLGPDIRQSHTDLFAAVKLIAKRQELDKQRFEIRPRNEREREKETRYMTPMGRPLAHSTPQRINIQPNFNSHRDRNLSDGNRRNYEPRERYPSYPARHNEHYRSPPLPPEPRRYAPRYESLPPISRSKQESRRDTEPAPRIENRQSNTGTIISCKYCKKSGHTIDECRRKRYNDSLRESSGNGQGPSGHRNPTPTDERNIRPLRTIDAKAETSPVETPRESQH